MTTALDTLKRPVNRMIRLGVVFAAMGALVNLVPFIGLTELGRLLLAGNTDSPTLWRWAALVVIALS
ncbi:ABC transporter ATP-binding protein, partial [Pseudomonas carnis]|nr:ABC transporter ATP-binding protein [Pseudomonas carnis]